MKKAFLIISVFAIGFAAGMNKDKIWLKYRYNRLSNELSNVYSISRQYENMAAYQSIPESKWEELHSKRDKIINEMNKVQLKLAALKSQ